MGPRGPAGPPCCKPIDHDASIVNIRIIRNGGVHNVQPDDSTIIINSNVSATIVLPDAPRSNDTNGDDIYIQARPITISSALGSHIVKTSNPDSKINDFLTSAVVIGQRRATNNTNYGPGNVKMTFYPDGTGGWLGI